MKTKILKVYFLFFLATLIFLPGVVLGQQAQLPLPACVANGNCGLCDILDTVANIIRWILGIVGGLALVLMVWHGFGWISSMGNPETIKKSQQGLIHTVLGVVIVMVAWQLVNIVIVLMVNPPGEANISLFNNEKKWYEYCQGNNECYGRADGSPCGNGGYCSTENGSKACKTGDGVNACDYWAGQIIGGVKPYDGYSCQPSTNCGNYDNLGPDYCSSDGFSCCKALTNPSP